jgi:hypothetical protein
LSLDEGLRRLASRFEVIAIACGLVGAEVDHADGRGPGGLHPDLGGRGLAFSLAAGEVVTVAPQVAALGGDVLAEVIDSPAQALRRLGTKRGIVGANTCGKCGHEEDGQDKGTTLHDGLPLDAPPQRAGESGWCVMVTQRLRGSSWIRATLDTSR